MSSNKSIFLGRDAAVLCSRTGMCSAFIVVCPGKKQTQCWTWKRLIAGFTYFCHKEVLLLGHPSRVILELVGTS